MISHQTRFYIQHARTSSRLKKGPLSLFFVCFACFNQLKSQKLVCNKVAEQISQRINTRPASFLFARLNLSTLIKLVLFSTEIFFDYPTHQFGLFQLYNVSPPRFSSPAIATCARHYKMMLWAQHSVDCDRRMEMMRFAKRIDREDIKKIRRGEFNDEDL